MLISTICVWLFLQMFPVKSVRAQSDVSVVSDISAESQGRSMSDQPNARSEQGQGQVANSSRAKVPSVRTQNLPD